MSDISVIVEHIAPGDRVPLHIHEDVNECILVLQGRNEITLGADTFELKAGDAVFVPKGTPHAQHNIGTDEVLIHAFFPSNVIDIRMLQRNPAPGTEGDAPKHSVYNMQTGEFFERKL